MQSKELESTDTQMDPVSNKLDIRPTRRHSKRQVMDTVVHFRISLSKTGQNIQQESKGIQRFAQMQKQLQRPTDLLN